MSRAPADLVNAVELAGRAATLERDVELGHLPRVAEAGGLEGTRAHAVLEFGRFEGRTKVDVHVTGELVLTCQRCLRPCGQAVDERASLVVVAGEAEDVPGGYEPVLGDAERLSLTGLIEEQLLLGLPLVPMHAERAQCSAVPDELTAAGTAGEADETRRPFANLRALLEKGSG
jgi:uncharacterized protein